MKHNVMKRALIALAIAGSIFVTSFAFGADSVPTQQMKQGFSRIAKDQEIGAAVGYMMGYCYGEGVIAGVLYEQLGKTNTITSTDIEAGAKQCFIKLMQIMR